ncbi:MAG: ECF-type sigma factor [Acidobacteriota bacterium]
MDECTEPTSGDVTSLLLAWSSGEAAALDRLAPMVYDEIRRLAGALMRREGAHTLQPTALANEVFLRLVNQHSVDWQDRTHFFSLTARMMRRMLIDHARRRAADRRGGGQIRVPLGESRHPEQEPPSVDLLDLDRALDILATEDRDAARLVELRFYGGLSIDEAAEILERSRPTVVRLWRRAKKRMVLLLHSDAA